MRKKQLLLIWLMAISILGAGFARTENVYRTDLRMFEIPPMQSMTSNEAGGEKGIKGTTEGTDVTASFPEGTVLVQTDLDKRAAENAIKDELKKQGYFKEAACLLPSGFGWWALGGCAFSFRQDEFGVETSRKVYCQEQVTSPSIDKSGYWLTVSAKSADEKEVVFGLKFECRLRAEGFPEGANRVLLDQDVNIPLGRMLLIGFSSKDSSLGKTVNFLAVYTQKIES